MPRGDVGIRPPSRAPPPRPDRRRRHRYFAGLPARVHIHGLPDAASAELADLSAIGCFLKGEEVSFLAAPGDELAFGCVLGNWGWRWPEAGWCGARRATAWAS